MKKILVLTIGFVIVYLLLKNVEQVKNSIQFVSDEFRKSFQSVTDV